MSANGKHSLCGFARGATVFKRNLQTSCFLIMFENMIARILLKRFFPFCLFFVFWSACSTDTVSAKDDVSVSSSSENSPSGISSAGNPSSSAENDQPKDSCQGTPGIPWDGTTAKFFACGAGTKRSPYIILTAEQLAKLSFAIGAGDKDFNGKYFRLEADILLNEGEVIDSKGALVGDSAALHKWTPIGIQIFHSLDFLTAIIIPSAEFSFTRPARTMGFLAAAAEPLPTSPLKIPGFTAENIPLELWGC